ncbi:hypothetical protein C7999DRAFT_29910 [Corynascus novoguineensis]|uniref:Uncharacterized protein n=1 Tax=Corynascus novoguineensis TaxID=1126955 RepID=A0AAN7CWF8_9PEZI|nr:hypothetical protein C7999DRAFT_29910 [Corynascus novoguineensis]
MEKTKKQLPQRQKAGTGGRRPPHQADYATPSGHGTAIQPRHRQGEVEAHYHRLEAGVHRAESIDVNVGLLTAAGGGGLFAIIFFWVRNRAGAHRWHAQALLLDQVRGRADGNVGEVEEG